MSICISPTAKRSEKGEITRIICPVCGEKVRSVGLLKDSRVDGLVFRCRGCGEFMSVTTTKTK